MGLPSAWVLGSWLHTEYRTRLDRPRGNRIPRLNCMEAGYMQPAAFQSLSVLASASQWVWVCWFGCSTVAECSSEFSWLCWSAMKYSSMWQSGWMFVMERGLTLP